MPPKPVDKALFSEADMMADLAKIRTATKRPAGTPSPFKAASPPPSGSAPPPSAPVSDTQRMQAAPNPALPDDDREDRTQRTREKEDRTQRLGEDRTQRLGEDRTQRLGEDRTQRLGEDRTRTIPADKLPADTQRPGESSDADRTQRIPKLDPNFKPR
jgi:hypothetical protein